VQAASGRKDLMAGELSKTASHLELSLKLNPTSAVAYAYLSAAMQAPSKNDDAPKSQREAGQHDPYNPILQKRLIVLYIHRRQYADAENAMKKYVKAFPQDLLMRHMLALAEKQSE
jgi:predicted Zn-dependent protease